MSTSLALELCVSVVTFAAIQSVFGVGLLVFGTPTLLLLGVPFEQLLAYLLPCSIVISFLQVVQSGGFTLDSFRKDFLRFAAAAVVVGATVVLARGTRLNLRQVVGIMLILTAATRLLGPGRATVSAFVRRHLRPLLLALGFLHGLSNLGGGLLTLIVGSLFEDKESIRRQIAFAYGLMASLQLVTLVAVTGLHVELALWVLLPGLAAATFTVAGQRLFASVAQPAYQIGLTALIALFGVVLVLPA